MPDGWALVKKEDPTRFANLQNLNDLARQAGQPWANKVKFKVKTPLTEFWTGHAEFKPRRWDAVVEIDGVGKGELDQIFEFIHDNCSHVDGFA